MNLAPTPLSYSYENQEAQIHYNQLDQLFSITDLQDFMGLWTVSTVLVKSNNVIRQFGEKLLDTQIPVGIRKEAFTFAGGMASMPTFSIESKTLREVRQFFSKHTDDVVRGVGGSGRTERVTQAVNNMSDFFEIEFGQKIVGSLRKTKKKYDGQSIYEVTKGIDDILKKGDNLYLDGRYKDYFEVFNKRGKVKDVLNLDGTSNSKNLI